MQIEVQSAPGLVQSLLKEAYNEVRGRWGAVEPTVCAFGTGRSFDAQ